MPPFSSDSSLQAPATSLVATRSAPAEGAGRSRADVLADRLCDAVLSGEYEVGQRLPGERELAERMGASRGTVRQALRRLEHLGLVEIRPGGGALVCPPERASLELLPHLIHRAGAVDVDMLAQLLDAQEVLMTAAARRAVANGTPEQRARARALLAELAHPAIGDREYFDVLGEVVSLMAVASGNRVFHLVRKSLWPPVFGEERLCDRSLRPPDTVLKPLVGEIDRAIQEIDPDLTESGVRRLFRAHARFILEALSQAQTASPVAPDPEEDIS